MIEMVRRGGSERGVARKFRVSLHTVQRWWGRAKGLVLGAVDWSERSHVAHRIANKTPADMERKICVLRKSAIINEGIKSRLGVRLNDIVPVAMKRVAF